MQRSQGYNNYVLQKVMHDLCVAIAGILYAYTLILQAIENDLSSSEFTMATGTSTDH